MKPWRVHRVESSKPLATGEGLWAEEVLLRREAALGIGPGSVFMTDPYCHIDPVLTSFFNSATFNRLAPESRKSYSTDYRVFFTFLAGRGKSWDEAAASDMEDFEDWRRRAPSNPRPIGGAKWVRELSALNRLYRWAVETGHIDGSPIRTVLRSHPNGAQLETPEATAHDVRSTNVKWLTPMAARRWRDVGLLGLTVDGIPDPSFRMRNGDRNAAYSDLLFDSGLRRAEGASLLTIEVPDGRDPRRYHWSRVASSAAKYGSGRSYCISASTLARIRSYQATSRLEAVAEAQTAYQALPDKLLVSSIRSDARNVIEWVDQQTGSSRLVPLDRITIHERSRLFAESEYGIEPLWLWLGEAGMPFQVHSWENVFQAGSARCKAKIGRGAPFCTPHMARHSFALQMLLALHHSLDNRFDLSTQQRRDFEQLYGNPWRMVKDLLGHRSEETTRNVYLAPVRDVQIQTLLEDDIEVGAGILQAIISASGRVQDVNDE